MSIEQAANVVPPFDPVTANDFRVRKFTSSTTHAANALPASWAGKYVTAYAESGGTVHVAFSKNPSAEVDATVSATAAGASAKVGGVLTDTPRSFRLPILTNGSESLYFVREAASGSPVVYLELSSD